ncbi:hypothetical protein Ddc_08912 [Ditylenchus destructor]|nr:hypothetical protein Ddc_08912 [Ditylenchus destructor]
MGRLSRNKALEAARFRFFARPFPPIKAIFRSFNVTRETNHDNKRGYFRSSPPPPPSLLRAFLFLNAIRLKSWWGEPTGGGTQKRGWPPPVFGGVDDGGNSKPRADRRSPVKIQSLELQPSENSGFSAFFSTSNAINGICEKGNNVGLNIGAVKVGADLDFWTAAAATAGVANGSNPGVRQQQQPHCEASTNNFTGSDAAAMAGILDHAAHYASSDFLFLQTRLISTVTRKNTASALGLCVWLSSQSSDFPLIGEMKSCMKGKEDWWLPRPQHITGRERGILGVDWRQAQPPYTHLSAAPLTIIPAAVSFLQLRVSDKVGKQDRRVATTSLTGETRSNKQPSIAIYFGLSLNFVRFHIQYLAFS